MPRRDHLAHQHRARRPFAAEAETLQAAGDEKLLERIGEAGEKGEDREPGDGDLQGSNPPQPIRQLVGDLAADRR